MEEAKKELEIPVTLGFDYANPIGRMLLTDPILIESGIPRDVVFAISYEEKANGQQSIIGIGMTSDKSYLGFLLNEVELTTDEMAHVISQLSEKIKLNSRTKKVEAEK